MARVLALAMLVSVLWAERAAAQSAIVSAIGDPASEVERARAGVIEVLAERGVRLVRTPDGEPCEERECAARMAGRAGVDFVVLARIEPADGGSRVLVALLAAQGPAREASAAILEAGAAAAAAAATQSALDLRTETRLGFLAVRTRPPGARVEIDGEAAGESPLRRMIAPGPHAVRIVPAEGEARTREVEVVALEETTVDVDLRGGREEQEEASSPPSSPRRTEPSPLNWLIGGGLAIAGVVLLISPLQTLATEGQCVDLIEGVGCRERVAFGAQSGILLGLGLASLAAAVVVDAVAPLRVEVAATPSQAMLRVGATF